MKAFNTVLFFALLMSLPALSQTNQDLRNCTEVKSKKEAEIFNSGYADSTINRLLITNERNWENCVQNCNLPDFESLSLTNETLDSKELKGKILVLNFWYIGCAPCIAEFPALNKLAETFKRAGVEFIAFTPNSKDDLQDFMQKKKFDFKIVPNAKAVIENYGIGSFPTTFIIDKDGKIRKAWVGGYTDDRAKTAIYNKAEPVIDALLKLNK